MVELGASGHLMATWANILAENDLSDVGTWGYQSRFQCPTMVVDDLRFCSDPSDKGFVTDLKEELYPFKTKINELSRVGVDLDNSKNKFTIWAQFPGRMVHCGTGSTSGTWQQGSPPPDKPNPPGAASVYGRAKGSGAQVALHDRAIAPQKVRSIACWVPTGGS